MDSLKLCICLASLYCPHKVREKLLILRPADYEPPFFRGCTEEEAQNPWSKIPLKMEVGNVNSKHLVLTLKVNDVAAGNYAI